MCEWFSQVAGCVKKKKINVGVGDKARLHFVAGELAHAISPSRPHTDTKIHPTLKL